MLLVLPVDILYLIIIYPFKIKCAVFFATEKWPDLIQAVTKDVEVACISHPVFIFKNFRSKVRYIPASIFYVPAAIGLFLPKSLNLWWSNVIIYLAKKLLSHFYECNAALVVHSDALPFGRCLVLAANELGIKSVCIQHGNFRDCNIIREQDGFLCAHNIVRSVEDAQIIAASNEHTKIYVLPDFFKIKVGKNNRKSENLTVLLLGEGYHIVDPDFNRKYLAYLELIQAQLISYGVNVVFRPHPSEMGINWGKRFREINLDPLEACLGGVDAVIGYSSTLLYESAEIGLLAFYVDPLLNGHNITGRNGAYIYRFTVAEELIKCVRINKKVEQDLQPNLSQPTHNNEVLEIIIGQ